MRTRCKVKYLGKRPILVGHKFVYQDEAHSVTLAQLAALQAQHGAALFQVLDQPDRMALLAAPEVTGKSTSQPSALYIAELEAHKPLLVLDDTPTADVSVENLNNQTEKPRRRRAKGG